MKYYNFLSTINMNIKMEKLDRTTKKDYRKWSEEEKTFMLAFVEHYRREYRNRMDWICLS